MAKKCYYGHDELDVGETVFVEQEKIPNGNALHNAVHQYGKKHGRKFRVNKTDGGYLVERVL